MNKVKELVISILDIFENVLDKHDINIPDEYRQGEESEARIFGETYYNLEDQIMETLKRSEIIAPIFFDDGESEAK